MCVCVLDNFVKWSWFFLIVIDESCLKFFNVCFYGFLFLWYRLEVSLFVGGLLYFLSFFSYGLSEIVFVCIIFEEFV